MPFASCLFCLELRESDVKLLYQVLMNTMQELPTLSGCLYLSDLLQCVYLLVRAAEEAFTESELL